MDKKINTGNDRNVFELQEDNMELYSNMEFEMKSSFLPNLTKSETLKILEVSNGSVVVQMDNSNFRGVFPVDHFNYWIKRSSLIYRNENEEKTS
jgi:hypothetical protein